MAGKAPSPWRFSVSLKYCHHKVTMDTKEISDKLSKAIVESAIEVHRILGPGLLESAYEIALCRELEIREIEYQRQVSLPLKYKGANLDVAYRLDILVEGLIILEIKSVERLERIYQAQPLSYLKLSDTWLGFLLNFNAPLMKNGIKRLVNG